MNPNSACNDFVEKAGGKSRPAKGFDRILLPTHPGRHIAYLYDLCIRGEIAIVTNGTPISETFWQRQERRMGQSMRRWFNSLKVSHKLMLISIFFLMPDSVMLYMFVSGVNANIRFAELEMCGNEYQRPLERLLELIPEHSLLATHALEGDKQAADQLAPIASQIDAAFVALAEVDSRIGEKLQFTPEGLAKRDRSECQVQAVRERWTCLKQRQSSLDPHASQESHQRLVNDVRTMITHAGDLSNLILDPDLDSYYLMDVTLLGLPQMQERLATVIANGDAILRLHTASSRRAQDPSSSRRTQLLKEIILLQDADLTRIVASTESALNEDANYYQTSPSLQARVPAALKSYVAATDALIRLASQVAESQSSNVSDKEFLAAGAKAQDESFRYWLVMDTELDGLLTNRINYYVNHRTKGLIVAACALLAALTFVAFITRSISGPLKLQAAEFQAANTELQAQIVERRRAEEALRAGEEAILQANHRLEERVAERTRELQLEIQERTEAEANLARTHKELLETSRIAGKAEIATGVLHNVGNTLNSVNVSATLIAEKLRRSQVGSLVRLSELVSGHQDNLAEFLTADQRGQLIPGYLADLARCLNQEREAFLSELAHMVHGVEHIKQIVSAQQSLAKANNTVLGPTEPAKLMESALTIDRSSLERSAIEVIREFEDIPSVVIDEHKVLQILVNLIGNAKHALQISSNRDKTMTLVTQLLDGDHGKVLRLQVRDNGIGISPSDITRIFSHGFTTKKDGHGFGLHSAALAAKEMGGTLSVASDGMAQGATFTLEVPIKRSARERNSEMAEASAHSKAAIHSDTNKPIVICPVPDAASGAATTVVPL